MARKLVRQGKDPLKEMAPPELPEPPPVPYKSQTKSTYKPKSASDRRSVRAQPRSLPSVQTPTPLTTAGALSAKPKFLVVQQQADTGSIKFVLTNELMNNCSGSSELRTIQFPATVPVLNTISLPPAAQSLDDVPLPPPANIHIMVESESGDDNAPAPGAPPAMALAAAPETSLRRQLTGGHFQGLTSNTTRTRTVRPPATNRNLGFREPRQRGETRHHPYTERQSTTRAAKLTEECAVQTEAPPTGALETEGKTAYQMQVSPIPLSTITLTRKSDNG